MKGKSIKVNAFFNILYTVINIIFPLIIYPYVNRILMAAGLGKVTFYASVSFQADALQIKEVCIMLPDIKIRCITHRHLAVQDYFDQIRTIALAGPEAVIIREKDLKESEYEQLAARVIGICADYGVPCIVHGYPYAAVHLGAEAVHLPLWKLLDMPDWQKRLFSVIGASVHSKEEALLAQSAGASYLTAGHVFATDRKSVV